MSQFLPLVSPGGFMWSLVVASLFQTALLVYDMLLTLSLKVKYIWQKKQSHAAQVRLLQPNYVHHWTDTTWFKSELICGDNCNALYGSGGDMQQTGVVQARFDSLILFLDYISMFSSEGDDLDS